VTTLDSGGTVGRYKIIRFLGAGAMGEVYLAEDPHIERRLAIKTVRLAGGRPQDIEDRKKRLLREARAAGRLLHPNVVALFDAGEENGLLYLAFEFVEGCDLASRLETGPPPTLREVLRVVRQVADALDYAHRQGIVHRDIKPSNILVNDAGHVKVADFGIAKVTGQNTELTVAGSVMGSPQYLSPEQIRGDELDGRSDIFSLGVVLYELLSGRRPFDGETITTLVYQILHKEPSISELRAVPLRIEQLLHRMLAKERDERLATAGLVAEELAAIERELPEAALAAPAAPADDMLDKTRVLASRSVSALAYADSPAGGALPAGPAGAATGAPGGGPGGAPYGGGGAAAVVAAAAAASGAAPAAGAPALAGSFAAVPAGAAAGGSPAPAPMPASPFPAPMVPMPPTAPAAPQFQPPAPPPPVARGASGSRLWLVLLAVVAILGIGIAASAYWIWQRYGHPAGEESVATATGPTSTNSAPSPGGSPNPAAATAAGSSSPAAAGSSGSSTSSAGSAGAPGVTGSAGAGSSAGSMASPGPATSPAMASPGTLPPATPANSAPQHATVPAGPAQRPATASSSSSTQAAKPPRTARAGAAQGAAPPLGAGAEPPPYVPSPEPTSRSRSTEPAAPPQPAAEGRDAAASSGGAATAAIPAETADRVLHSGLELAFRVNPPDAYVLLDGGVIGRAEEWNGEKGGRAFTLPGTGAHLVKIRKPGMKDYRITVEASATRGVTPVVVNLQPLPSAQVETSDLQTVRVREAVALRLQPEVDAVVQVDGTSVGPAKRYAGRFGHSDEWLSLPPGPHRVTVIAAGYARRDLAVEITPGAEKARQKIDVPMSREAGN
jgi:tRNA A-37 threonylcarbamoyl transferase component Bud32